MNALWIRVDASIGGKDVVWRLAEYLRDSAGIPLEGVRDFRAEAVGLLVMFWGGVAQHASDGVIADKSDEQLESWAGWRGEAGRFAQFIRATCVTEGRISDWDDTQGKLEERRRRDRERKAAAKARADSAGIPPEAPRNSAATVRNGTLRTDVTKGAAPKARTEKAAPWMGLMRPIYRDRYDADPPKHLVKALRTAVAKHGAEEVARRFRNYCTRTEGRFFDPFRFVSTWREWDRADAGSLPGFRAAASAGERTFANALSALEDIAPGPSAEAAP